MLVHSMHPPRFLPTHTIQDWPECHLEAECPSCGKKVVVPLRMLRLDYGGARVLDVGNVNLTVHGRVRAGGWDHGAVTLRFGRTSPRSRF
jgi:hypothetical protein